MLETLLRLTDYSISVFDMALFDPSTWPKNPTLLFASSEFASTIEHNKPEYIKAIFILENDKNKVDQRERFATAEDLIFQLADEIYRCYKKEESEYTISGDASMATIKAKQANQIHSELKKVHERYINDHNSHRGVTTATTLLWLKSELQDNTNVEKVQNLFEKVVSSFIVCDSKSICHNYLLENKSAGAIFLIIDTNDDVSTVADFEKLPNIKGVYRYGPSDIANCDDLCSRLTCDLIAHYNKLGDDCSAKQDGKTAKDMFLKAHELCKILGEL
jgi:hypothetical protein